VSQRDEAIAFALDDGGEVAGLLHDASGWRGMGALWATE
jgi:hypothetical protein